MEKMVAYSGNAGPTVRSDCEISLELTDRGGIVTTINSRVLSLYGESIREQCAALLDFFGIRNCVLKVNDSGALPFVIAARTEAAVRQIINTDREFLPSFDRSVFRATARDRFRFARLYVPGNTPAMMINAGLHSADGVILDLEDSVAPSRKDEARILVRNALRQIEFREAERMVRINQGSRGLEDLRFIIPHHVNLVLIPKCEDAGIVRTVDERIRDIQALSETGEVVHLIPIIESARGVEQAFAIATSSENVVALAIGLEDYTADIGVMRSVEGTESFYARTRVVNAAKAAGIQALDSVFSDTGDDEGLAKSVAVSRSLGFEGMGCIHPRQIAAVKDGFAPCEAEIEKAMKIVTAYDEAERKGLGVVALGTKMIDPPVAARALRVIDLAVKLGLIPRDWMKNRKETITN
ncbi:MAG: aldolase/citrate lyase family protein [Bacteroidales bacterium]|jgi:citrate lyase subunit beta/citryl-CoA lyase|nr:aldolase/citrate lyase family protein [Bacteroidales bacterium]